MTRATSSEAEVSVLMAAHNESGAVGDVVRKCRSVIGEAFDIVVVHSFSRFFRDHFELEFYVRKLAKNGVRLVSITQEMGDDPMHVMMRQIMALFDEYGVVRLMQSRLCFPKGKEV